MGLGLPRHEVDLPRLERRLPLKPQALEALYLRRPSPKSPAIEGGREVVDVCEKREEGARGRVGVAL